jgi:hypothetical protein
MRGIIGSGSRDGDSVAAWGAGPIEAVSASGTLVVVDAIRRMDKRGLRRLDVRREDTNAYNRELRENLAKSVWAADSQSWYKLADGTITKNWPHRTTRHRRLLRTADLGAYATDGS